MKVFHITLAMIAFSAYPALALGRNQPMPRGNLSSQVERNRLDTSAAPRQSVDIGGTTSGSTLRNDGSGSLGGGGRPPGSMMRSVTPSNGLAPVTSGVKR